MAIKTPARVRNRIQATAGEISDEFLNELSADEQALVEAYAQKTFAENEPQIGLARSICTELQTTFSAIPSILDEEYFEARINIRTSSILPP
jgi:hypothetical protein